MLVDCAKRFIERTVRQPSYLVNAFRYVQWAAENKYHRLWPIPDVRKPRHEKFKTLLIVLRTSDTVQHCSSSRELEEFGIFNKRDVIKRCGLSLVEAVRVFRSRFGDDSLRMVLVVDRLSEEGRVVYRDLAPFDERKANAGNRETFLEQVEVARNAYDDTLVCFLEDDYLLDSNVFCEAFELFNETSIDGFTPHFHPGLVNGETKVRLLFLNGRFYAHVPSTTCTFFISARDVRRNLTRLRRYYGSELGCINEIWRHGVCVAPCCRTLAEHLHKSDLSYLWNDLLEKT